MPPAHVDLFLDLELGYSVGFGYGITRWLWEQQFQHTRLMWTLHSLSTLRTMGMRTGPGVCGDWKSMLVVFNHFSAHFKFTFIYLFISFVEKESAWQTVPVRGQRRAYRSLSSPPTCGAWGSNSVLVVSARTFELSCRSSTLHFETKFFTEPENHCFT